jgi:hypothetical protein
MNDEANWEDQEVHPGDHFGHDADLRQIRAHVDEPVLAPMVWLLCLGTWKRQSKVIGMLIVLDVHITITRVPAVERSSRRFARF